MAAWTPEDVSAWMEHVNLQPVEPQLRSQNVDGPKLLKLKPSDLTGLHIKVATTCVQVPALNAFLDGVPSAVDGCN